MTAEATKPCGVPQLFCAREPRGGHGLGRIRFQTAACLTMLFVGCASPQHTAMGPFHTLADAQVAVRSLKKQGLTSPLTVIVDGDTRITQPLVFTNEDSGTAQNSIAYVSDGVHAISGGMAITGWRVLSGQIWAANVGSARFHQLFINDTRATPARIPSSGFFNVDGSVDFNNPVTFKFRTGQMSPSWLGATVVLLQTWGESRLPITAVDPQTQMVTLANQLLPWMIEPNARYWVENSARFLDMPGEWFLDQNAGIVYYYAAENEDLNNESVVAPITSTLLVLNGAQHIAFSGFTFEYTDWALPAIGYRDVQSAYDVPAAIMGNGVSAISISESSFKHLGTWAIELAGGSVGNMVVGNEMSDLGAGGIEIGESCTDTVNNPNAAYAGFENCQPHAAFSNGNEVTGNTIHDIGQVYIAAAGIWLGQAYENSVCSNQIFNTNQIGISAGWTWGYGFSAAKSNLIAFNTIHDIGRGMLDDMGGVYTLGVQPGTIVRNNLIYRVTGYTYGGWGIYEDQGSSDILTENNVVYLAHSGGFVHNSDGSGNHVRNNIFALGDTGQVVYSNSPPPETEPQAG